MKALILKFVHNHAALTSINISGKKNSIPLLDELVPACYVLLEENIREIAVELRDKKQIPILTHQEYT